MFWCWRGQVALGCSSTRGEGAIGVARAVEGAKLAWLCKELPTHKPATIARILNGQRKWMR